MLRIQFARLVVLVALDESEAYKSLDFLRDGGTCFANALDGSFPHEALHSYTTEHKLACAAIDADRIAREVGVPAVANTALLGFAASHEALPFTFDQINETINIIGREHMRELNTQALHHGAQAAKEVSQGVNLKQGHNPSPPSWAATTLATWGRRRSALCFP